MVPLHTATRRRPRTTAVTRLFGSRNVTRGAEGWLTTSRLAHHHTQSEYRNAAESLGR